MMRSLSPDAIGNATGWVMMLASGSVATTLAVLAVGSLGFLLLTGHFEIRRGGSVILGIFILFGAGAIARSLVSTTVEVSPSTESSAAGAGAAQVTPAPTDDRYAHPSLIGNQ